MLQQTQVETVIPYYERFLQQFPTPKILAKAPIESVLKSWEGLGYYSRARHLHLAAQMITKEMQGRFPEELEDIRRLPGVGPYMTGAISSIVYGKKLPAVDGNVRRIFSRIFLIRKPLQQKQTLKTIQDLAQRLVNLCSNPSHLNQGLMDLGATICTPKSPQCRLCPIKPRCLASESDLQDSIPLIIKKKPIPIKQFTAGVIRSQNGRILITQRPLDGLLGGLWKFPGGERIKGLGILSSLEKSVQNELGINVSAQRRLARVQHQYTHFKMTLHLYYCIWRSGAPKALGCKKWRWVKQEEFDGLAFSKAEHKIMSRLA